MATHLCKQVCPHPHRHACASRACLLMSHPRLLPPLRRSMQEFDVGAPELYLYSEDDRLADAGKLRELIELRRSR